MTNSPHKAAKAGPFLRQDPHLRAACAVDIMPFTVHPHIIPVHRDRPRAEETVTLLPVFTTQLIQEAPFHLHS